MKVPAKKAAGPRTRKPQAPLPLGPARDALAAPEAPSVLAHLPAQRACCCLLPPKNVKMMPPPPSVHRLGRPIPLLQEVWSLSKKNSLQVRLCSRVQAMGAAKSHHLAFAGLWTRRSFEPIVNRVLPHRRRAQHQSQRRRRFRFPCSLTQAGRTINSSL